MLKLKSRHVLFSLLFLLSNCKPSGNTQLPEATGKPGSLVIVSDSETRNLLKREFNTFFLGTLPDSSSGVPFFEILQPDISEFLPLFYNQRTVLVLVTSSNREAMEALLVPFTDEEVEQYINDSKSSIISKQDVFAKHQHMVYLFGKNNAELKAKLTNGSASIIASLMDFELRDHNASMLSDTGSNSQYTLALKDKYGISVRIPESFKLIKSTSNFYWFQMDTKENGIQKNIGLIIHAYPFKDSSDFTYESIRSVRDTFCKHHIPGELPGTYMATTESTFYPARTREMMEINGYTACKIKGWWTIKGITMSGPFVRYVVRVPEKNILFAFEGFVYRPEVNLKERDIRIIEAIALSIQ